MDYFIYFSPVQCFGVVVTILND